MTSQREATARFWLSVRAKGSVYFLRPISCFIVVPSIINYLLCTGFYQRASAIRCSQRVESWLDAAVGGGFRGSRLEVQAALQGLVLPVRTGLFDSQYESVQDCE